MRKESKQKRKRGQFYSVARRFAKSKTAVMGLIIIVFMIIMAIFPGQIVGYTYNDQDFSKRFQPPSAEHPLGTDDLGRDIWARIVWGSRTSLSIGVSAIAIACIIGVTIGLIAGYFSGAVDQILMRLVDIIMAVPNMLLGISVVAAMGSSASNLTFAIGLGSIAPFARMTRSAVLTLRGQEYIEAAIGNGASTPRILLKYILPNSLAPIIVEASMGLATAIISISGLSFIGLGVPAPTPEWGSMLTVGRAYIRDAWWVITFPGIAIMLAVLGFNLLGDGLRDALDPRLKA
ncbi:MAG: ABC transporter permease [Eubacteriales bacterium]|nr:ABC transporter permease [Eubacteriales bacterium]